MDVDQEQGGKDSDVIIAILGRSVPVFCIDRFPRKPMQARHLLATGLFIASVRLPLSAPGMVDLIETL